MNIKRLLNSGVIAVFLLVLISGAVLAMPNAATPLGTAFTYQGRLKVGGSTYTGTCDLQFALYDDPSAGAQLGSTLDVTSAQVSEGLFTAQLDFGTEKFFGDQRWLEIWVRCPAGSGTYTQLTPRQELTASPYALYADRAGNAWSLMGNAGTSAGTNYLGTTDNQAFEIKVNDQRALRIEPNTTSPNLIGGYSSNAASSGVYGATISGGAPGAANRVTDQLGTVAGGSGNLAGDDDSNLGDAVKATVGGGTGNSASAEASTVGGGEANTASSGGSTVGGGLNNLAGGGTSTIGGGMNNQALAGSTTIAGGENITVTYHAGTVAGGSHNWVEGDYGAIGGGQSNRVTGGYGTIGGGGYNTADNTSTICGGYANTNNGTNATIAGGMSNTIDEQTYYIDSNATIGGGLGNNILGEGYAATIAGGQYNQASAPLATIPGGHRASASNFGQQAYASSFFEATGDGQTSLYVLYGTTTDGTTAVNLYLDPAGTELISIGEDQAITVDILVVALSSDGLAHSFHIEGLIKDSSGTGYIVGATTSLISGELGISTSNIVPTIVGGDFTVQVKGASGKSIRWVATVRTAEVSW